MNRYRLNQPRPATDFTPVLGSRVKLTKEFADVLMLNSGRELTREYMAAIRDAKGLITADFPGEGQDDGQWEVIWDGDVVMDHGMTFFPPKDGVELE